MKAKTKKVTIEIDQSLLNSLIEIANNKGTDVQTIILAYVQAGIVHEEILDDCIYNSRRNL